ncbi:MAG TPA: AsmA-like C-terminal region-containing protein, partial [Bacteroidales bacterium]|nr:AsmA-like C-terminal region-containing protein [Bacteroidales bacterium]
HFVYQDHLTHHLIDLAVNNTNLRGQFRLMNYLLEAKGTLKANQIMLDSAVFVRNRPVEIDILLNVLNNREFQFQKGQIRLNDNLFDVKGIIASTQNGVLFDTNVHGHKLHLGRLLNDLPENFHKYIDGYRAKGILQADAQIVGLLNQHENPAITASFQLSDAELHHRQTGINLLELQFKGTFDNGASANLSTATLSLSDFNANINNGVLRGEFSIFNFLRPKFRFYLYADADAGDLVNLFRINSIERASGRIKMDLNFHGGMSERNRITGKDLLAARATGTLNHNNVSFEIRGKPLLFSGLNGSFRFSNNDLLIEAFSGMAGSSDFNVEGFFRNVLPYLFLEGEPIQIMASLRSNNLNFDELLKHSTTGADTTYRLRFSERIGFNLNVNVGHLKFRKFEATNLRGTASLHNRRFFAEDLHFNAMDGKIKATGLIDGTRPDILKVGCHAEISGVDINKLFYQMGNFGQEGLTDRNISGKVTSDLHFSGRWTPALQVDPASIETTANIRVEQGALTNYEPLVALSRFLRLDDFNQVTFSTLENQIRIKDRTVFIPDMEINSSALNIKLAGQHHFDNQIDYRVQLLLREVLGNNNRQRRDTQEQFGTIIDDGLWRTRLFLRITGPAGNPSFAYDTEGVREKIRDDLRRERETLRDILRQEFGGSQNPAQNPPSVEPQQETRPAERRRRPRENKGFTIEWEETNPRQ